ncbi:MAG: alpha/beta hydrolase [Bacteroidetes bacterium]|nr:alpha/beta hydrolase [Bacteroidota bacterium]
MKWLLLLASFVVCACGFGQAQPPTPPDNSIRIGKTEEIHSFVLNEQRGILVSLPGSYYDTYFFKRRYPVVYLLDGDSHFASVTAMIKQMSDDGGLSFPEMIVVGILNTDRNRDLTPTRDTTEVRMGRGANNHSGGGPKFMDFLANELIPHIDSAYLTAPYRVFIGHSLGGLMAVDALVNHPGIFNAYLAIDPSMWWDRARLLRRVQTVGIDFHGASLFLAGANSLQPGLDTVSVMHDTATVFSRHMQSIFTLRNTLMRTAAAEHLYFGWKYYPEYNHGSVPLVAEYDGLRNLFDFYRLDFRHDELEDPAFKGDTLLAAHFSLVSRRMGYTVAPPEVLVNNIGYTLLGHGQAARAFYYFHLNVENYPKSFNVYDSMGDWYLAQGKKEMARKSWEKALSLREFPDTRKKLQELQSGSR